MVGSKAVKLEGPTNQEPANLASNVPLPLKSRCSICFFLWLLIRLIIPSPALRACGAACRGRTAPGHADHAARRQPQTTLVGRNHWCCVLFVASARPRRTQLVVCLSQASPDPAGSVPQPGRTGPSWFSQVARCGNCRCSYSACAVVALSKWCYCGCTPAVSVAVVALCQVSPCLWFHFGGLHCGGTLLWLHSTVVSSRSE